MYSCSVLHAAIRGGHIDIVKFFVDEVKFGKNNQGWENRTPLHDASEYGYLEICMYINIHRGGQISDRDSSLPNLCTWFLSKDSNGVGILQRTFSCCEIFIHNCHLNCYH